MAERRMFTKKITDDDNFLNLSSSAQAMYLHLAMSADDDGFCNNVTMAMFKAHASVSDLEALLNARYLIQFENGVIVIKHWRMANAIRGDRYKKTSFVELLDRLEVKENGAYTLKSEDGCHVVANWLPNGCQMVATGKDRLEENRVEEDNTLGHQDDRVRFEPHQIENEFEQLWKLYPRKKGKENAYKAYYQARRDGSTFEEVQEGLQKMVEEVNRKGTLEKYIPYGGTWFHQKRWKDEYSKPTNWEEEFDRIFGDEDEG